MHSHSLTNESFKTKFKVISKSVSFEFGINASMMRDAWKCRIRNRPHLRARAPISWTMSDAAHKLASIRDRTHAPYIYAFPSVVSQIANDEVPPSWRLLKVDAAGWPASESPICTWVLPFRARTNKFVITIRCMSACENHLVGDWLGIRNCFISSYEAQRLTLTTEKKNGPPWRFFTCTGAHAEHKAVLKHYTFSNDSQFGNSKLCGSLQSKIRFIGPLWNFYVPIFINQRNAQRETYSVQISFPLIMDTKRSNQTSLAIPNWGITLFGAPCFPFTSEVRLTQRQGHQAGDHERIIIKREKGLCFSDENGLAEVQ